MLQTFCIEGLRISAQYRVQILQSRKDICWHLWSASFLQSVELVRFELRAKHKLIVWNMSLEPAWTTEVFLALFWVVYVVLGVFYTFTKQLLFCRFEFHI